MSEKHGLNCDCEECINKRAFSLSAKLGYPIDYAKKIIQKEIAEAKASEQQLIEESKIREQKESEEIEETLKKARKKVSYAKKKLESVEKLEGELILARQKIEDLELRLKAMTESRETSEFWRMEARKQFESEIAKLNSELQKAYDDYTKLNSEKVSDYWNEFKRIREYYEKKLAYMEKYYKEWIAWDDYVVRQLRENP